MHLRLLILFLFISCFVAAQNNSVDTTRKPCITAIGQSFGNIASAKIDGKVGSLKSSDGKLELRFPEGSLANETTISIQSVNNSLTENNEGAYQLEPSGIRFAKPIQLIFRYTNPNQEMHNIATQDKDGRWWILNKIIVDTIAKTISGFIPHFSHWALFEKLVLKPKQASIKTGATIQLSIYEYSEDKDLLDDLKKPSDPNKNYSSDADLLTPLVETHGNSVDAADLPDLGKSSDADLLKDLKPNYSILNVTVNGIENGNSEVGTIANKKKLAFIYTAPGTPPEQNPVGVTVKLQGISYNKGIKRTRSLYLTSNIKILGNGYLFTYIHKNFAGCFHYIDSSSCIVRFDSKSATLSDVTNYKPWSDWDPCTKCNNEWLNKESFKANVEIWGMAGAKITPASKENPFATVYVSLMPSFGNTPSQRVACPKSPVVMMPSMPVPADPKYIHFETDGADIIVHYLGISGKNIISKKVKNEETIIRVTKL